MFEHSTRQVSQASFLVPCKDGPDLNKCAMVNGNKAISDLVKGDAKDKIPSLDPMIISELSVADAGSKSISVNLTFKDMEISGLKNTKLLKSEMDTSKKTFIWVAECPNIKIVGNYKISGKILLRPITGDGPMELNLEKPKMSFTIEYETFENKGETYMKIAKTNLKYTTDLLRINLQNLFNGDKTLGDNMNSVLNDNWQEMNDQLRTPVAQAINLVVRQLVEGIVKDVPLKHIVKP